MRQESPKNSTRGFTLLEVLIAVLIVGIIATAAIPLLSDYTEQARDARMVANVQALDRAVQRYELDHQAPWGFVYEPLSEDLYIPYNWEGGLGFVEQLEQPTDTYGNVLGDPGSSVTGPCVHGPYVSDAFAPATLLLGVGEDIPWMTQGGYVVVVGKKKEICHVDPDRGVRLVGTDVQFMRVAPNPRHRVALKQDEGARELKPALLVVGPRAHRKGYTLLDEEGRTNLRAERGAANEAEIARLEQLVVQPHPDRVEFLESLQRLIEQYRSGEVDEQVETGGTIQNLVGRLHPGLIEEARETVARGIRRGDDTEEERDRFLVRLIRSRVVEPTTTEGDIEDVKRWSIALGIDPTPWGEAFAKVNVRSLSARSPSENAKRIKDRAETVMHLVDSDDDDQANVKHPNAGLSRIVREIVAEDVRRPIRNRTQEENDLLSAARVLQAERDFQEVQGDILAAAKRGDKDGAKEVLHVYVARLSDAPRISIIENLLRNAIEAPPEGELEIKLGQHASELQVDHVGQIDKRYRDMLLQGGFTNEEKKRHELALVIGLGGPAPPPGSKISNLARIDREMMFWVGYLRKGPVTDPDCGVEAFVTRVDDVTVAKAKITKKTGSGASWK